MTVDPIDELIKHLKDPNSPDGPRLREGVVLAAGPEPLRVLADGIPLEGDDLKVSGLWTWDWTEDTGAKDLLRAGDQVLLASPDGQTYYLICRVVGA